MKRDGLTFPEAVASLAQLAGLPLPSLTPEQQEATRKRAAAFEISEAAAAFFESQLATKQGAAAMTYLAGRGVTAEQIAAFRLGFAPGGREACCRHLVAAGYSADDILAAGIAREGASAGQLIDTFSNRIIFPIRDRQGRVAGFAGRAIGAGIDRSTAS